MSRISLVCITMFIMLSSFVWITQGLRSAAPMIIGFAGGVIGSYVLHHFTEMVEQHDHDHGDHLDENSKARR